jgi:hypothetical protein
MGDEGRTALTAPTAGAGAGATARAGGGMGWPKARRSCSENDKRDGEGTAGNLPHTKYMRNKSKINFLFFHECLLMATVVRPEKRARVYRVID